MFYLPVAIAVHFNNNRDIAMIRTGKTRLADVDILKGLCDGICCQQLFSLFKNTLRIFL